MFVEVPSTQNVSWYFKMFFSLTPKHIQEGLSPGHLKKAKLMFFFTRYPSSSLLKAYFPDVQVKSHTVAASV